jgi:hypothetical protein
MAENFLLGMEASIYYHATLGTALGSMTELTNVRDVGLDMSAGEADITTRANSGWRATAPTLREGTVTFAMVWKPDDPGFAAIKTAFLTNAELELAVLDQDRATSGAQGPKGAFVITGFVRNEALEEAITVDVTAKLSAFGSWVDVA